MSKLLGLIVFLIPFLSVAQEVPMMSDDPTVGQTMTPEIFNFVANILESGNLAHNLKCSLRARRRTELRKFISGEKWVETLDIEFSTDVLGGMKMKVKIPSTANYGSREATNQWSGVGEDIKIELGDYDGHWLKFTHDGAGRIVQLQLGDLLRVYPCGMD